MSSDPWKQEMLLFVRAVAVKKKSASTTNRQQRYVGAALNTVVGYGPSWVIAVESS